MFDRVVSKVRLLTLAAVAIVSVSAASAATIKFEDLPQFSPGNEYVEKNFKFTAPGGQLGSFNKQALHLDICCGPYANTVKMTTVSGGAFSLLKLDLLPLTTLKSFVGEDTYVRFTGMLAGVSVGSVMAATQIGTNTIKFGKMFRNIDSFMIEVRALPKMDFFHTDYHFDIDRIVARAVNGSVTPAPVPLPAAGFLMLGGLAALGALRRKRKPRVA